MRGTRPVLALALVCALLCGLMLLLLGRSGQEREEPAASDASASLRTQEEGGVTLYCPDAGKADVFLLKSETGAVLIDTGENPEDVLTLLREQNVTQLDALILSHFDKDHIGGAAAVLESLEVKTLYRTAFTEDSEPYAALMEALEGCDTERVTVTETTECSVGGVSISLYPPLAASYEKDEDNNASLIAAVEAEGVELLFTGDALKPRVQEFLEQQYDGTQYRVLKVPHHGGENKPTALLLEAFVPEYAILTSSPERPESEKLLEHLAEEEVQVLLTREGGFALGLEKGTITLLD